MKLCFPVEKNQGLLSLMFGHFGAAPLLLVVDTESQEVAELQRPTENGQPGRARLAQLLDGPPIDALVVGSLGAGAYARLRERGIKVYRSAAATIADNLLCLADKRLQEFDGAALCAHAHEGAGAGRQHLGHGPGRHGGGGDGCGCH